MKSFLSLFVLITIVLMIVVKPTNSTSIKSNSRISLTNKKPKGPNKLQEFNLSPFVKSNQKYVNHTYVDIDSQHMFFLNHTYPNNHLLSFSTDMMKNHNFQMIDDLNLNFVTNCHLARLKISLELPITGFHGQTENQMEILGIFLDDKLIGSSTRMSYNNKNYENRGDLVNYWEPLEITTSVFNVLQKMHKFSVGIKTTTTPHYIDSIVNQRDYGDKNRITIMEQTFIPKINVFMRGECMKVKEYN